MTSSLGVKRHAIKLINPSGLQIYGKCNDVHENVAYIMTIL